MNFKEIKELIKLIQESDLTEFKMKDGEFNLSVKTKHYADAQNVPINTYQVAPQQMPMMQQIAPAVEQAPAPAASQAEAKPEEAASNLIEIKSPIVGTFYRSASPDKPPYIKVGDSISEGSVVCIVEAMKLFNEIESEVSGKIVKVLVEDATPIEYDTPLFLVDPKG